MKLSFKKLKYSIFLIACAALIQSCGLIDLSGLDPKPEEEEVIPLENINFTQNGVASYYADRFDGRQTASGEIFRQDSLTAAHKHLPFGTIVRVTNLKNDKQVIIRINDRGPFVEGRIIDLSRTAAEEVDLIRDGLADVLIEASLSDDDAKRMKDLIGN